MFLECSSCRDEIEVASRDDAPKCADCRKVFCPSCLTSLARPGFDTSDAVCEKCLPAAIIHLDLQILRDAILAEAKAGYMVTADLEAAIEKTVAQCERDAEEAHRLYKMSPEDRAAWYAARKAEDKRRADFAEQIFQIGCQSMRVAAGELDSTRRNLRGGF